jgi:hypothetical protein
VGDEGARPLAGGSVFWESPDVWTEGSHGINQPVVGEPTRVFARISNLGLQDATGVTVKFWWANPSLAISDQTAHLIGTGYTSILSNNTLVFACPTSWVPVLENSGHECLFAQAYVPYFDPMSDPFAPPTDRHVGQKNENLVLVPAARSFEFELEAANFTTERQHVIVEARRGAIPRDFAKRFARKAHWPKELVEPARTLPFELEVDPGFLRIVPTGHAPKRCGCGGGPIGPPVVDSGCLGPALATEINVFRPGEIRRVTVRGSLPASARPGEIHVLRITQRVGQLVSGGYTLYVALNG